MGTAPYTLANLLAGQSAASLKANFLARLGADPNAPPPPGLQPQGPILPLPPGTSTIGYDACNTDGFQNTLRADGVKFAPWINDSPAGSIYDLPEANLTERGTFRAVGGAGKINNLPAVSGDGTTPQFYGLSFTDIPQPITYAFLMMFTSLAGNPVPFQGGSLGTDGHEIFLNSGHPEVYAGTFFNVSSLTFVVNKWHLFIWQANGASSIARLDGVQASTFDSGSAPLGGFGLFAQAGGGNPMAGSIAEARMWSGSLGTHPSFASIEGYFADKFGVTPQ